MYENNYIHLASSQEVQLIQGNRLTSSGHCSLQQSYCSRPLGAIHKAEQMYEMSAHANQVTVRLGNCV